MPKPGPKNGKRIALVGGGPASLAVARDLAPLGYHCTVFDGDPKAGGMMRTQIPKFRLPDSVVDEETDYILDLGVEFKGGHRIDSMKKLLSENFDAIFVGSGAPRGRELDIPGRKEAAANVHIGIEWLASVSFGHIEKIGRRVIVLGGGNTAMDCCRTARRLGGDDVKVIVRSGFDLDLGTGRGVLAIAAARLLRTPVLATDIDIRPFEPRATTQRRTASAA